MIAHRTQMWELYDYCDFQVRVVQQWHNPYGAPMIRIETVDRPDPIADGMTEADFLTNARYLRMSLPFEGDSQ